MEGAFGHFLKGLPGIFETSSNPIKDPTPPQMLHVHPYSGPHPPNSMHGTYVINYVCTGS